MAIEVDPTLDAAFTAAFFLEAACVFGALLWQSGATIGHTAAPLPAPHAALLLACATLCTFGLIGLSNRTSRAVGRALSRRVLRGDPLAKARTMHKFEAQSWSLVVHASMAALEHHILFVEDGVAPWWAHYPALWTPHPHMGGQTNTPSIHLLYLLQMALWLATSVQHRFVEERHKDYFLM